MSNKYNRYTITSALPYANGPVHIGHLAGVYVPADIYARYLRLKGEDVLFLGGSDEHGVPITIRAKKENTTPQAIVDKYHEMIKTSFENFGISFDVYSRTSSEIHKETASQFFLDLFEKGEFAVQSTEQFYDEKNNEFLADRYIKGQCPKCNNPEAYGDQCESCGSTLSSDELINPISALSGEVPVKKETKHWYLPLDKYENWLKQWIVEDHKEWKPNVYGQCKSWIDQGLKPRAVTRDLDWGVPVPLEDAKGKVLYVWFDAPIGYISATKEWAKNTGNKWEDYWQKDDTKLVHFIGKDNIVFHCIIFPGMLKAHGDYILPDNVPANEFLNLEGEKISTSRNWAVWLHEYLEEFPEKQDALRYTLCVNAPETKDNDFTWKDFQARNNNELVAIYGNFINRAVVLTHKYYEGKIPELGELYGPDLDLIEAIHSTPKKVSESIENYRFREALNHLIDLARAGNKYLADTEPWHLIKTDEGRVKTILNLSLQVAANLSILASPFLPFSSKELSEILNYNSIKWNDAGSERILKTGHQIEKAKLLFQKIEDEAIDTQINKLKSTAAKNIQEKATEPVNISKEITFDDFTKLDIRVGTIKEAEKVEKADKLLKLLVDLGTEERVVVSGIAQSYAAQDVIGQQVSLLTNLAPRKIRGILSQGMILMAEDESGKLSFVAPDRTIANGGSIS